MARTLKRTTKERQDREKSHQASTFSSDGSDTPMEAAPLSRARPG